MSDVFSHENAGVTQDKFFVSPGERWIMIGTAPDNILYTTTVNVR